jgi:hypothetical protein
MDRTIEGLPTVNQDCSNGEQGKKGPSTAFLSALLPLLTRYLCSALTLLTRRDNPRAYR